MPLRDHFRPPLDDVHSWDELHGLWPAVIVQQLMKVLPEPYFAAPTVHLGTLQEIDVGTFGDRDSDSNSTSDDPASGQDGGAAVATYAPPQPTVTLEPALRHQDVYEVRVYDSRRNRRLLAAIEIVSPSNKDRAETRGAFVAKVAALLNSGICVSIVDVVSIRNANLYDELLDYLDGDDPALGENPQPMYAATARFRANGPDRRIMDAWYYPLAVGQPLPTLPVWLKQDWAISLELESSYEETCRTLRIR